MIILGELSGEFWTKWSEKGSKSIYAYSDGGIEIAVMRPGGRAIDDIEAGDFEGQDFSSRARGPEVGDLLLMKNRHGRLGVIEIVAVNNTPERDPNSFLEARYRVLPDEDRARPQKSDARDVIEYPAELISALDEAVMLVEDDEKAETASLIGHNGPPPEAALTKEETSALRRDIIEAHRKSAIGEAPVEELSRLRRWCGRLASWSSRRWEQINEGFFRGIGQMIWLKIYALLLILVAKISF